MTLKIILLRSDELRHKALAASIRESGNEVYEIIEKKIFQNQIIKNDLVRLHFQSRRQVELSYFSNLIYRVNSDGPKQIVCQDINCNDAIEFARKSAADLLITFGCSILKMPWFDLFNNRILGIHLGLSPYYRGHGTNFFPFVNNDLGAVGYTLMNLDEGIDTGNIIHQAYADMNHDDNIHIIGTRLMSKMFIEIVKLINSYKLNFNTSVKQPYVTNCRVYRKQDFNEITLKKALLNISNGSIKKFLANVQVERNRFPLIQELNLDAS